jgi:hypothetical protein
MRVYLSGFGLPLKFALKDTRVKGEGEEESNVMGRG